MAKTPAKSPAELLVPGRALTLSGVADGAEGLIVADLARAVAARPNAPATSLLVICRDGPRMAQLARALAFFAPEIEINEFPAWDCLPYDRVSPHAGVVAQRMTTLSRLARLKGRERPGVVLTTVNAALQRVPARDLIATQSLSAAPGNVLAMDGVTQWLELNGYNRTSTVREPGDYAVRGGIVDLYPPGIGDPVRLDFFGDTLEIDPPLRCRDAAHRRTRCARSISCRWPNSSSPPRPSAASAPAMSRRSAPRRRRSALRGGHAKAAAIPAWSTGCRCSTAGSTRCSTICRARRSCSSRSPRMPRTSASRRSPTITTRAAGARRRPRRHALQAAAAGAALSRPKTSGRRGSRRGALARLTPFADPDAERRSMPARGRAAISRPSAPRPSANVFDAVDASTSTRCRRDGKRVVIAMWSEGSRERMSHVLADHGLHNLANVAD